MLDNGYISINTVISRLRLNPWVKEDFNRNTAINLIGQCMRLLNIKETLEHSVELIDIYNYKGYLPEGLKRIIQSAYRIGKDFKMDKMCNSDCCEYQLEPVNYKVNITNYDCKEDCNKIIIEKKFYERNSYLPVIGILDGNISNSFKPIYPSTNNFGLFMYNDKLHNSYKDGNKEHGYIVDEYGFQTSFKDGQLLISFLRTPLDDEGLPLIINDETVIQACEKYYYYKQMYWKMLSNSEPYIVNIYSKIEQEYYESLAAAKAKAKMPSREQLQQGYKLMNTLIPNEDKFNSYFGYY